MQITNYGHFNISANAAAGMYFTNEHGLDWYAMQRGEVEGIPQLRELGDMGAFISSIHPVWLLITAEGVVHIVEQDPSRLVPDNKTILGVDDAELADVEPGMLYQEGQILPKPYVPPPPYQLSVSTLWSRMTDPEAEEFDAAMSTASPLRLRKAFNAAAQIVSDTELFGFTRGVLAGALGEARADELLAA